MFRNSQTIVQWLRLIRLPNQFSVPGDVIGGLALAGGLMLEKPDYLKLGLAVIIAFLLYNAGLLLNDWFDRDIDAKERPDRPIPSGAVSARQVMTVAILTIVLANVIAFFIGPLSLFVTIALSLCVIAYNAFAKNVFLLGFLVMSSCRSLSLLLGASIIGLENQRVIVAAVIIFLYIMAVCWIAVNEVDKLPPKIAIISAFLISILTLLPGLGVQDVELNFQCIGVYLAALLMLLNSLMICIALWRNTIIPKTGKYVGALIKNLILIQAFWVAIGTHNNCLWAVAMLLLWPLAQFASRKFYGS